MGTIHDWIRTKLKRQACVSGSKQARQTVMLVSSLRWAETATATSMQWCAAWGRVAIIVAAQTTLPPVHASTCACVYPRS